MLQNYRHFDIIIKRMYMIVTCHEVGLQFRICLGNYSIFVTSWKWQFCLMIIVSINVNLYLLKIVHFMSVC